MATLFSQPPRQDTLKEYAIWVCNIGHELGYQMDDPKQVRAACDVIQVALMIQNADVLDEQLGGFGQLLQAFVDAKEGS